MKPNYLGQRDKPSIASIVAIFLARALFIEWTKVWLFSEERGLVEFIHFLFPALVALIGLRLLFFPQIRKDPLLLLWALALAVGGIYLRVRLRIRISGQSP